MPHPGGRFFGTVGGARSNGGVDGPDPDRMAVIPDEVQQEVSDSGLDWSSMSSQCSGWSSERMVTMCLINMLWLYEVLQ